MYTIPTSLRKETLTKRLIGVPEGVRDPFTSLAERVRMALGLYRFKPSGGSLLDWATAQTGLGDPLTVFNRHELEELFGRFRMNRDTALAELAREMWKQDAMGLARAMKGADPDAKQVLRKLNIIG